MRRDLYARNQHEPNDLRDLAALGIAAAYCDVVATEKQWVSVLKTAGIEEMLNVRLVSKPKELAELLV